MKDLLQKFEKNKKKFVTYGTFSLATILASMVIFLIGGDFLTNKSYDLLVKYVGGEIEKPHKDIVLLLIDENSLQYGEKMGLGRWPWGRNIYPEILNFINKTDPPRAIFFDILFVESDRGAGNDRAFAQAIGASGNVYENMLLTYNQESKISPDIPPDVKDYYAIKVKSDGISFGMNNDNDFLVSIPCLRSNVNCYIQDIREDAKEGKKDKKKNEEKAEVEEPQQLARGFTVASFSPDSDGVYRRGRMLFRYKDSYFPSMTLAALMAYTGEYMVRVEGNTIKVGRFEIPVDDDGEYLVNYYNLKNRVPAYSMSALMQSAYYLENGEIDKMTIMPDMFKDKIVIIGVSAVGGSDLKNTPILGVLPGPEIHANIISNILQGNHLTVEPVAVSALIVVIIILLAIALVLFVDASVKSVIALGCIFLVYGIVAVLFFNRANYLSPILFTYTGGLLASIVSFIYRSMTEGAEKRKYSKVLSNMIDTTIVSEALKDLEALRKGGEKEITAFFSDIASFTTISERLSSQDLAALLNEYLSAMTIIMKKHHGTLDKYIGDAIVGIFGAPVDMPDNAILAARSALEMQQKLAELRKKWTDENAYCPEAQRMHSRIGLNTGKAKVGFMGTENLASYTMMGDTVNLAARLESAGKDYGVSILISEFTKSKVEREMFLRMLDIVRVKGKNEPVRLYELVGKIGAVPDNLVESTREYEEGYRLYLDRKWQDAIAHFEKAKQLKGGEDYSADMLILRCKEYMEKEPDPEWDGVFTRTHK